MNVFKAYQATIRDQIDALSAAGELPDGLDTKAVTAEPPRDPAHGDLATNAAMVLAKQARMKPRDIAEKLAGRLRTLQQVDSVDIAGPGFLNLRLDEDHWRQQIQVILADPSHYGDSDLGAGERTNVEYVSANPTGPLHLGHVRGAVYGDALAALLSKAGYDVTKEFYTNDAGGQVQTLARSLYLRYREALGEEIGEIPQGMYPGDYLIPIARDIVDRDGEKWRDLPESDWLEPFRAYAVDSMMRAMREDMAELNVHHDLFFSEKSLHDSGRVQQAFDSLEARNLIYTGVLDPPKGKVPEEWEPRPQTLFKSTEYGDDIDRPLKKSDGSWTYFAADIAYHYDKYKRGFDRMIDVFGADHGGHVKRLKAAVSALSGGEAQLDIRLCQMVRLLRGGVPVQMSKRAGEFVTLRNLLDEVGPDVVRFVMLTRKNDAQLEFDYVKVTEQSKDNPVFYVQYAHARVHSVMRNAARDLPDLKTDRESLRGADLDRLVDPAELALIRQMATWPRIVETAAQALEPHRVAFYLYDLASGFHALWNKGNDDVGLRFIMPDDAELTRARLAMLRALADVIASGLSVLGVQPVEEMR